MKKTYLTFICIVIASLSSYSQDTIVDYYDKNWNKIDNKDAAYFYGKTYRKEDKTWGVKDYFISGEIQMTGTYKSKKKKVKMGHFTYYYEDGKTKSEGDYVDGKNNGMWTYYYENGKVKSRGNYTNGNNEGVWVYYHDNGKLKSEGNFKNDKHNGEWHYYYDDSNLQSKGIYENGLPIGKWEYWHENKNKKAEGDYIEGKKNGLWKYYHDNGVIADEENIKNGELQHSTSYFKNGVKKHYGTYKDKQPDGEFTYWNANGTMISKGKYEKGKKEGEWIRWFENGDKKVVVYDNGKMIGKENGGLFRANK